MSTDTAARYRETLHRWAAQYIPDDATVTSVEFRYDDGYDPTFTNRESSISVVVNYESTWTYGIVEPDAEEFCSSVGAVLTALFAIEETP